MFINTKYKDLNIKDEKEKDLTEIDKIEKDSNEIEYICESCKLSNESYQLHLLCCYPSTNLHKVTLLYDTTELTNQVRILNKNPPKQPIYISCLDCNLKFSSDKVYVSTEDIKVQLCLSCIKAKSFLVKFPQLFYSFNQIKISTDLLMKLPILKFSECIYGVIQEEQGNGYLLEVTPVITNYDKVKMLYSQDKCYKFYEEYLDKMHLGQSLMFQELKIFINEVTTKEPEGTFITQELILKNFGVII